MRWIMLYGGCGAKSRVMGDGKVLIGIEERWNKKGKLKKSSHVLVEVQKV